MNAADPVQVAAHPALFTPAAFAAAFVAAAHAHAQNTGEPHFAGDVEDFLAICLERLPYERLRLLFQSDAAARLLRDSTSRSRVARLQGRWVGPRLTARDAAVLVGSELGFHPRQENEDANCAALIADALAAAGPAVFQVLVDRISSGDFFLPGSDFPSEYAVIFAGANR